MLITNGGRSPLRIVRLQVSHPALGVSLKKTVLRTGETARMRITVTRKHLEGHNCKLRLLMITDDPERPKVEIDVAVWQASK